MYFFWPTLSDKYQLEVFAGSARLAVPPVCRQLPAVTTSYSHTLPPPLAMESINRFIFGPTPEQRVREWQNNLRQQKRNLDREMRQVGYLGVDDMYA